MTSIVYAGVQNILFSFVCFGLLKLIVVIFALVRCCGSDLFSVRLAFTLFLKFQSLVLSTNRYQLPTSNFL